MIENEDRIAEREARRWVLSGRDKSAVISTQSARAIASWWHGGQWTRAYSIASTGSVPMDADRLDFVTNEEYGRLSRKDRGQIDALMAWVEAEKIIQHDTCEA